MNKRQYKKWLKKHRKMSPMRAMGRMIWTALTPPNRKWFSINSE